MPCSDTIQKSSGFCSPLADGSSLKQVAHDRNRITTDFIPALKLLTPESGAYSNEVCHTLLLNGTGTCTDCRASQGDPDEPDFKEAFYGPNYDRLLEIKDKWDPEQVLYGKMAVGGDRWKETEEGRLCQAGILEDMVPYLVDQTSEPYHAEL